MRKIIIAKDIATWSLFALMGMIGFGKYVSLCIADLYSGVEMFIPGVVVMGAGIALLLAFFITRVIKHVKKFNELENSANNPVAAAAPSTTEAPQEEQRDYTPIIEIAAIISGGDEQVTRDFTELIRDRKSFLEKHGDWCNELMEDIEPQREHHFLLMVLAFWLTGYDTNFKYGAYIDWKEETDEIVDSLSEVIRNLSYPVSPKEINFTYEEDTWEVLKMINAHFQKKGYVLCCLNTHSDCYHLFITTEKDFERLEKLGKLVDFDFHHFTR